MKKIALITAALLTIAALPGCVYHPGYSDHCGGGTNCSIEIIRGGPLDPCAYLSCPLLPWNWCCGCRAGCGHGYGGCGIGGGGPWMSPGCCEGPAIGPMVSTGCCDTACGVSYGAPAFDGFGGYGGCSGGDCAVGGAMLAPAQYPSAPQFSPTFGGPTPVLSQPAALQPVQQMVPPMPPVAPMGGVPQTSLPAGLYQTPMQTIQPVSYTMPAGMTAAPMMSAPAMPAQAMNAPAAPQTFVPPPNAQWIRAK